MGRDERHDHSSSIALLQERFRQLQRVKEMREERELRKMMINEPKQQQQHLITPSSSRSRSPPHNVSLSLWPITSQSQEEGQTSFQNQQHAVQPPKASSSRRKNTVNYDSDYSAAAASDSSGVDTSLHL